MEEFQINLVMDFGTKSMNKFINVEIFIFN